MHDTFTHPPMANTSCYWGQANPETWVFATIANVNKTRALVINSEGKVLGRPSLEMFSVDKPLFPSECRPIPMTDANNRMFAEVFRRKSLANKLQAYVFDSLPIEALEAINTLIENNNQAMAYQSTVVVTPIDDQNEDGSGNQEGSESDSEDDDLQDEDDWDGGLY